MRVSRSKLINVVSFIKFLVKSKELEFFKVTNDEENLWLQKLKNCIEKATFISLGIFRRAKISAAWQRLKAWNSIPMSFCPRELSFSYTF